MPKARRPLAVVVSISAPAPARTRNPTQRIDDCDQVFEITAETIELPDDESVAGLKCLQAVGQT